MPISRSNHEHPGQKSLIFGLNHHIRMTMPNIRMRKRVIDLWIGIPRVIDCAARVIDCVARCDRLCFTLWNGTLARCVLLHN